MQLNFKPHIQDKTDRVIIKFTQYINNDEILTKLTPFYKKKIKNHREKKYFLNESDSGHWIPTTFGQQKQYYVVCQAIKL